MKVYAIVVLYNGKHWINRCFKSLLESTIKIDVIAIDNGSSDGGPQFLRSQFPEVEIIAQHDNLGFGAANNIGLKKAYRESADFVFLLNQDAWVEASTVERLIAAQKREPSYNLITPMQLFASGEKLEYGFSKCLKPTTCPDFLSDAYLGRIQDRIYEIEMAPAAVWLLTRYCVASVGGFNPSFFHYGEDNNYAHRVAYHGLKMGVYPMARAYHDVEFRGPSPLNSCSGLAYKMRLILYSDPNNARDVWREVERLRWSAVRSALRFSRSRMVSAFREYRQFAAVASGIHRNRQLSRNKGSSFL